MNRLSTAVLCLSILFSLNFCNSSKYYYSPRPDTEPTMGQSIRESSLEAIEGPKAKKKREAEESLGNKFFTRGKNKSEKE